VLAPYRTAFATPGAVSFSLAGLIGRLPISTLGLGIVLLVEGRSGSYGLAGSVSGVCVLAEAIAGPVLARLIDRTGQRRTLIPALTVFAVGLLGLVIAVERDWGNVSYYLFAAAAGASYPPIGACVRARWTHALEAGPTLHTAFSIEAVNDELVFITGPVLVTVLATRVHELAGLLTVLVLSASGVIWLSSQRSTEPPAGGNAGQSGERMSPAWLTAMVLAAVALGALFGATEVVTVAFADERGHAELTGFLLAGWAFGSMLAGLVTGAVSWKASSLRRFRLGAVGLALAMVPLPFVDSLAVLFVALFVAGFAISPTLVASVSLIEETVPASRLTEGITWLTTGIALGVAPGAAISGRLIDEFGASTAYIVPVVGGVVAAAVAWLTHPSASKPAGVSLDRG
jgi:MFS family permease